jgi:hypothetical protein
MFDKRGLGVMAVVAVQILWAGQVNGAGAVAVGIAPGGAQRGFAYGMNSNHATAADAQTKALDACKSAKESNAAARSRCRLIGTFNGQCASVAMDPKDGTPGVGWAIAADEAAASKQALANCEATAGPSRAGSCKVSATRCDTGSK